MASLDSARTHGQIQLPEGYAPLPTTLTTVSSFDTCVFQIVISNTNNATATVTIQDFAGNNLILPPSPLPAYSLTVAAFPEGLVLTGGLKWMASTTGVSGELFGFVK